MSKHRITLADVAEKAGVSRALVSIVMRGAPGASEATREQVRHIANELGYRPDARARMLAQERSKLIGVVFGMSGTFHFHMIDALYAAAERRGYELILSALTPGRDERRAVEGLLGFQLDALIMLGPHSRIPVMSGKLPVVAVGWEVEAPEVDSVRVSEELGMAKVVAHLVACGHRDIWHIDGGDSLVSRARSDGYLRAMRSNGLEGQARVLPGGENQLDGSMAAREILLGAHLPSAIVAFNDEEAVAVLEVMRQAGVRVPQGLSVVGWDDSPSARLPHIQLTSVRQDPVCMGELAIERAIDRVEGRSVEPREIILDPELVVRATSGPLGD